MATADKLMTAEEYASLPGLGYPSELIMGRIVRINVPQSRHGQVCSRANRILGDFADDNHLGHVLSNDSGVMTQRDPDAVRGADVSFYSYQNVPKGPVESGYIKVAPEVVVEICSLDDRWPKILGRTAEYLEAGVAVVCVLDPGDSTAQLYRPNGTTEMLGTDDILRLPELGESFSEPVSRFFE
ncbi:MAG: hypothetical protein CMJ64_04650 [Planctomycetaceae bacterium]|jgi:Uma2 family endonuclease|nr:hypothetical protein [Planctomycetaceae bacterium]